MVDAGGAKAPAPASTPALTSEPPTPQPLPPESHDAPVDDELPPIPWHLKLLAGAVALYLGFRAWQGVEWIVQKF